MIARRLEQLLSRLSALNPGAPKADTFRWSVVAIAGAAVLALGLDLSAAQSTPVGYDAGARRVAADTRGDLREAALQALVARMDPAAAAVAKRFDPMAFEPQAPLVGFQKDDPALQQLQEADDARARLLNAELPFATDVEPAPPFVLKAKSRAERERAIRCLTNAIYYEAALEPLDGQRAIAQVVLNRVRDPDFPKSICAVVYQGAEKVTGCQFSFACDGAQVREPLAVIWNQNRKVAEAALNGYVMGMIGMSTHYHADYVSPYWAPEMVKISQIGAHIFYRWPGQAGLPAAFSGAYAGGETRISEAVLSGQAARAAATAAVTDPAPPAAASAGLRGAVGSIPPGVSAVAVADGQGGTKTRIVGSFATLESGRRAATPEEVARINALVDLHFPTAPSPAAPAQPAPTKPAEAATSAPLQVLPTALPAAG